MRGKIQIRYQYNGETYNDTLDLSWTERNVEEASRIRIERIERLRQGLPPTETIATITPTVLVEDIPTFGAVAQELLDHAMNADDDDPFALKLSTRNGYRDLLNAYWQPTLGKRPIDRIIVDDLRTAVAGVKWKAKRKANALGALR